MKRLPFVICIFLLMLVLVRDSTFQENFSPSDLKDNSHEETVTGDKAEDAPTSPVLSSPENTTTSETASNLVPSTTTLPGTTSTHSHSWRVISVVESTCTQEGFRTLRCACGADAREVIAKKGHLAGAATCQEASVCRICQTVLSPALGHSFVKNTCSRCSHQLKSPVFVLGKEIEFDQSLTSICETLGLPTDIITEGNINSLVYASDLSLLTVIQTDENGLWGVFTMDPEAKFLLDGETVSIGTFYGERDLNSDAYFRDIGSCRVFGFKDAIGTGGCYGIWMRYSECRYDYISDPRLNENYSGQNLLSFYFVNALRKQKGLPLLTWSDAAYQVATEYSEYMIRENIFGHDGSYGTRLQEKGITWRAAGENISQGYYNSFFVCDAYYNSQSHRDNLLSPTFTHVGMGYRLHSNLGTVYGAQIFYTLAQ